MADLADAVADVGPVLQGEPTVVADLQHDSRAVAHGDCFVAVSGVRFDGHDYVSSAVASGATGVIAERPLEAGVPVLLVPDTRQAMPRLAARVHRHPSRDLSVVGVTGTNGKTTVTHMIEAMVDAAGQSSGVVGTVGARIAGTEVAVARTTPEATDLQRLLRRMADAAVDTVALEVSSHALTLGRVDAIEFAVVGFTNLSQDHLDFHGTMEAYAAAKRDLFTSDRARHAVIWRDDTEGAQIAATTSLPVTTVGFADGADVVGRIVERRPDGSGVDVAMDGEMDEAWVPLAGDFNVANALVAVACVRRLGISLTDAVGGLAGLATVPGRFENIDAGQRFTLVVDYAHTPVAVERIVAAARAMTSGRVIAVGGAAGDRDPEKREALGAALSTADMAVLTSDNPRTEDPGAILASVQAGSGPHAVAEVDRAHAIEHAIGLAEPDDIVLILGKGHETTQDLGDQVIEFDDRAVAAAAVRRNEERP